MSRVHALVTLGPTDDTVTIQPMGTTGVRGIEKILHAAGIAGVCNRRRRTVYVQLGDLAQRVAELTASGLTLGPETEARVRALSHRASLHERARRVIAEVQPLHAGEPLSDLDGRLDPHQAQAVAAIVHPDVKGLCLFDEQGLGKTVTTLFAYHRMRQTGSAGRMLVFAPKSMVLEWLHDARRFFGDTYRYQALTGSIREKRAGCDREADIYVTNFETAVRLATRLQQFLARDRGRTFLVVDESFFVKNADALRTRAIRRLRGLVDKCVVLCGTPAPNRPQDLVEQFNIADNGQTFRGVTIPDDRDLARRTVADVIEARGVYMRRLKQRVLDLPDQAFNRVLVPMEERQEAVYRSILLDLIGELERTDDVQFRKHIASFMARRAALLQTCSHPGAVVEGYRGVPAKLVALDCLLEELIERRREKVVVWSFYRYSLDAVWHRYQRYSPVRFDGSVVVAEVRREAVRRFQEDDDAMLFVGNPAAAGAGITLHRARFALYESFSNQAAHYLQSLDRIHRRGQIRDVEYLVLLCAGTMEEPEYARLLRKQTSARMLLGDDVDEPPTRETMLREALDAARALGIEAGAPAADHVGD